MTKMEKLRKWLVRLAVTMAIFIPIYMAVAALGYRFGWWDLNFGYGKLMKAYAPKLFYATAIVSGIALLLSILIKPRKGWLMSLLALVVPIAGTMHAKSMQKRASSVPPIHDISTDTQDPPVFTSVIVGLRGDESNTLDYVGKSYKSRATGEEILVVEAQKAGYPELSGLTLEASPDQVFKDALSAVKAMGWTLQSQSEQAGLIEATDTTLWFGFKDDVIVRIRPQLDGGSLVDVRSISRFGGSDIGANAARIEKFLEKLEQS